jgi:hypothetical protein
MSNILIDFVDIVSLTSIDLQKFFIKNPVSKVTIFCIFGIVIRVAG